MWYIRIGMSTTANSFGIWTFAKCRTKYSQSVVCHHSGRERLWHGLWDFHGQCRRPLVWQFSSSTPRIMSLLPSMHSMVKSIGEQAIFTYIRATRKVIFWSDFQRVPHMLSWWVSYGVMFESILEQINHFLIHQIFISNHITDDSISTAWCKTAVSPVH